MAVEQGQAFGQGVGGDFRIQLADGRSLLLAAGLERAIKICRGLCAGQGWQLVQQQVNAAPALVVVLWLERDFARDLVFGDLHFAIVEPKSLRQTNRLAVAGGENFGGG